MVSFGSHVDFSIPHIKIRNLNKHYAVQGNLCMHSKILTSTSRQGKCLALLAKVVQVNLPSRTLNGLERISEGHIHIHQQDLATLSHTELIQLRQRIGMIFQHFNLMSAKTVYENVALPLKVANYPKQDIEQRVNEVLQLVGLSDKAQHYPSQLSGGQKQRVGIAVHWSTILKFYSVMKRHLHLIQKAPLWCCRYSKINHKLGITIVLITHEMQVIREICDQVVVIDAGEIVESGEVWSVFSQPQQGITQELLNLEQLDLPFRLNAEPTQLDTHAIFKISSTSDAHHPDLKQILEHFPQTVHLYQSQVDTIQNHLIGTLVIAVPTQDLEIQSLLQKLKAHVTHVEVLGYARPTH
jgi:D-methionine transport system ATP-binding protein